MIAACGRWNVFLISWTRCDNMGIQYSCSTIVLPNIHHSKTYTICWHFLIFLSISFNRTMRDNVIFYYFSLFQRSKIKYLTSYQLQHRCMCGSQLCIRSLWCFCLYPTILVHILIIFDTLVSEDTCLLPDTWLLKGIDQRRTLMACERIGLIFIYIFGMYFSNSRILKQGYWIENEKCFILNMISCLGFFEFEISNIYSCSVPLHLVYFVLEEFFRPSLHHCVNNQNISEYLWVIKLILLILKELSETLSNCYQMKHCC